MKLSYHHGRNFGDALNPLIFNALFPNFFDDNEEDLFVGIGSIIGLKAASARTRRRIYFSSGFAAGDPGTYGALPKLGPLDDVVCVRGPLTAQAMGLPSEKAIADGAILAVRLFDLHPLETTTPVAYMPHVGSYGFYRDWEGLLATVGIQVIDPSGEPMEVMRRVQCTGLLLAEAMHGAIMADAIGIPWIPVRCYGTINSFKWRDFTASMGLEYQPQRIPALFDHAFSAPLVRGKLERSGLGFAHGPATFLYNTYQERIVRGQVLGAFKRLRTSKPFLSDRSLLGRRMDALLDKADHVRRTYGRKE